MDFIYLYSVVGDVVNLNCLLYCRKGSRENVLVHFPFMNGMEFLNTEMSAFKKRFMVYIGLHGTSNRGL